MNFNEMVYNKSSLKYLVIIAMIGILLLLFSNLFSNEQVKVDNNSTEDNFIVDKMSYEEELGRRLEEILQCVKGLGSVEVELMIEEGFEYEYVYNVSNNNKITNEDDNNGGTRIIEEIQSQKDIVVLKDNSGNENPLIRIERKPVITGVIVVAEGAENSEIKYEISRSISNYLNLPIHKINVFPYER